MTSTKQTLSVILMKINDKLRALVSKLDKPSNNARILLILAVEGHEKK
jgi:hypothetical protein